VKFHRRPFEWKKLNCKLKSNVGSVLFRVEFNFFEPQSKRNLHFFRLRSMNNTVYKAKQGRHGEKFLR
jgi:hypothetical protein